MKRTSFLLVSLLLSFFISPAQQAPSVIQWQKCIGGSSYDYGYSSVKTTDGGYLIVAATESPDGDVPYGGGLSTQLWLIKLNGAGTVQWTICLGGGGKEEKPTIKNTPDGGFIVAASSTSDNAVLDNHGPAGSYDAYVAKLDKNGNVEWQKLYGGTSYDVASDIQATKDGGYIFIGATNSNDGDVSGNHGQSDIWVVKLNANGTIAWQNCYGGSGVEDANSGSYTDGVIQETADGYVFAAQTKSTDGQVSGFHQGPYDDIWAVKINSTGTITWQKCLGGTLFEEAADIRQTNDGGFLIAGTAISSDGDVPPKHSVEADIWLIKLQANGNIQWSKVYGGSSTEFAQDMELTSDGGAIIAGSASSIDGDVSGSHSSAGIGDAWVFKVNSTGTIEWQKAFGGTRTEVFTGVLIAGDEELLLTGYTQSNDGDVSGGHNPPAPNPTGLSECWIVKTAHYNTIKGTVFIDRNANGVKDGTDVFMKEGKIKTVKAGSMVEGAVIDGQFNIGVDTGTYSTTYQHPYYTALPASKQSVFNSWLATDSFSFALQPIPGKKDYRVNLLSLTPARPGYDLTYKIQYGNTGTDTLINKPVKLVKDARVQYLSAIPAPSSQTADTLVWNLTSLLPGDTGSIVIQLKAGMLPVLDIGATLKSTAYIDSTGDINPVDNSVVLRQMVTGSFDPNDKTESHGGHFYKSEYDAGEPLLYTIRFQNTGNDTAFNITVRDTLSTNLDLSTFEMVSASHAYQLLIKDGKYCTWTFTNILLPDSNVNEPASHGYISYRIKPKGSLQLGDVINNSASIYFDFNLPVKTNTQVTNIEADPVPPPAQPVISGLVPAYCSSLGTAKGKILNLPAAGTSVTVTLDGTAIPVAADSTFTITLSTLTAGNHQVAVTFSNASGTQTTQAGFTLTKAATPNVNITANITTIVSLTNSVVITATAASGGGKNPLYTFAWDRNFANLLQNESANSAVTIPAASFAMGDNKVYVKLKSSEDCYTKQTDIDSITIRRDAATGIVDVDFPGQVINIYPNPFNGPVIIDGLQTGKTYTLAIYNLNGQQVYSRRITNRSSTSLNRLKDAAGVYWLSIYDEKKKRLLGSVKLIKQ